MNVYATDSNYSRECTFPFVQKVVQLQQMPLHRLYSILLYGNNEAEIPFTTYLIEYEY